MDVTTLTVFLWPIFTVISVWNTEETGDIDIYWKTNVCLGKFTSSVLIDTVRTWNKSFGKDWSDSCSKKCSKNVGLSSGAQMLFRVHVLKTNKKYNIFIKTKYLSFLKSKLICKWSKWLVFVDPKSCNSL